MVYLEEPLVEVLARPEWSAKRKLIEHRIRPADWTVMKNVVHVLKVAIV